MDSPLPTCELTEARSSPDGQALLSNLCYLSETAPAVAKAIFSHARPNTHAMRGANQLLRDAVNRSVSTIFLAAPTTTADLRVGTDLGVTFPNATKAKLDMALHPDGSATFLAHLAEACPRLLAGLQAMDLKLRDDFLHPPSVNQLATFLVTRCCCHRCCCCCCPSVTFAA
jgi:hypothetical protein